MGTNTGLDNKKRPAMRAHPERRQPTERIDAMNIIYKSVDEIIPYINNPRNNDNAVDKVASSIKNFGFKVPIVLDKDDEVVAGHTRLKAAKRLGMDEVPCIVADDLTDEQVKAFRLADNKVSEFAEWDEEMLEIELDLVEEINMSEFGFDELDADLEIEELEEDDFDEELPEEPKAKYGEVYQLGRHRLMCGDSTDDGDVNQLLGEDNVDMLLTDPPYNIDYKGVADNRRIKNDKMTDSDFTNFISEAIRAYPTMYVFCSWQYVGLFQEAMKRNGVDAKAMIVWDKVNPAQHLDKYFKQHELILYYGEFGGHRTLRGDVWQQKRQRNTVHPTMKPIELLGSVLKDNPSARNIYDAFGGSGSTLMACEQLGRTCYMMELDPKYVDVIINRWEEYTGEEAVLIEEAEETV